MVSSDLNERVSDLESSYHSHYIAVDEQNHVVEGWSDGPYPGRDPSGGICINEQGGYQFRLFSDGEENPVLYTEDGIPLYHWDGKQVVIRTNEEIEADRNKLPLYQEHVPEPTAESLTRVLRAMAPSLPLNIAVEAPELYPEWRVGVSYGGQGQPQLVSRMVGGKPLLFKCQTPHKSQEDWSPENSPSLWYQVVKEGTGTYNDPFVINSNLSQQYYKDKYYLEGVVLYLCIRDSGIPIAYTPSQLIGQYFEVVA